MLEFIIDDVRTVANEDYGPYLLVSWRWNVPLFGILGRHMEESEFERGSMERAAELRRLAAGSEDEVGLLLTRVADSIEGGCFDDPKGYQLLTAESVDSLLHLSRQRFAKISEDGQLTRVEW
jgi:hypothetical protein